MFDFELERQSFLGDLFEIWIFHILIDKNIDQSVFFGGGGRPPNLFGVLCPPTYAVLLHF